MVGKGHFLSNISWGKKLFVLTSIFIIGSVILGLIASYALHHLSRSINDVATVSQLRINAATSARIAIVEMGRARSKLIAEENPSSIRTAAREMILQSTYLSQALQKLKEILQDNKDVDILIKTYDEIRTTQNKIIIAGKKNLDDDALLVADEIAPADRKIETLSQKIIQDEEKRMQSMMQMEQNRAQKVILIILSIIVISTVVSTLIATFATRLITRPLHQIRDVTEELSKGNLQVDISMSGKDEVCETANSLASTIKSLSHILGQILQHANNLDNEAENVNTTSNELEMLSNELTAQVNEIEANAMTINHASDQSFSHMRTLSNVAQTVTDSTMSTLDKVNEIVYEFEQFGQDISTTQDLTRELEINAKSITAITNTIQEISEQTNLLALNAAIEAARAGEHGRGFAVVADEVRQLAMKTNEATGSISGLVSTITKGISSATQSLTENSGSAKNSIEKLSSIASEINLNSEHTHEIKRSLDNVVEMANEQLKATSTISLAIESLKGVANDAATHVVKLSDLSNALNIASDSMKNDLANFTL